MQLHTTKEQSKRLFGLGFSVLSCDIYRDDKNTLINEHFLGMSADNCFWSLSRLLEIIYDQTQVAYVRISFYGSIEIELMDDDDMSFCKHSDMFDNIIDAISYLKSKGEINNKYLE